MGELGNEKLVAGFKLKRVASIRTPYGLLAAILLIVIACLGMTMSIAAERSLGPGGPPLTYGIDEVRIRLIRHPGNAALPAQRVSLSGSGSATLEQDGKTLSFTYEVTDLLAVINALYKIRFFDLPGDYTNQYSVFLKDGKTVETTALRMLDVNVMNICFTVAGYEKCVSYSDGQLPDLENIAKRIFSGANELLKK
ncbi:hypothetical protein [Nitrosospira lacus]|nr:hypothetical protein [Nitrosospira lacus]